MSKKKSTKKKSVNIDNISYDVLFISQLLIGLIVFFSIYFQYHMGPFGAGVQWLGLFAFGEAVSLFPWVLFLTSPILVRKKVPPIKQYAIYLIGFCFSFLTWVDSFFPNKTLSTHGKINITLSGSIIEFGSTIFGTFGIRFLFFSVALVFLFLLYDISVTRIVGAFRSIKLDINYNQLISKLKYSLFYTSTAPKIKKQQKLSSIKIKKRKDDLALKRIKETPSSSPKVDVFNAQKIDFEPVEQVPEPTVKPKQTVTNHEGYVLPPLDLLTKPRASNAKQIENDMMSKAQVLEMALDSFNVNAKVVNVTIGPSVSRFELQPGEGVKISKITNLNQDIALKLAVPTVRIEAPIPGKALVGIEVPNADIAPLNLRSIIQPNTFFNPDTPLDCILGQRITGEGVTMNLNKMPHILVAGSTGSGKSVCVNAIILSILMKATPDEVKFLMIDPKKVELSLYSDIPHLLAPVVTNPHKAAATLKQWALAEMERRYELFTENGVKDLAGFNALAKSDTEKGLKPIPYIVVIIDEFADLMMVASQEVENTICRLAQMARATGIHLVIATQRPSVNVVTGLIKANVPSRISFAVQSQIDSRTVLDMAGAEKLLGRGDMLYLPVGASKPVRVQGVFVSEAEVNAVVKFIKNQAQPDYVDEIL